MTEHKCTHCGANITASINDRYYKCSYCGATYEKEVNKNEKSASEQLGQAVSDFINGVSIGVSNIFGNNKSGSNNSQNQTVNDGQSSRTSVPPRPEINIILAIVLLWIWIVPGIIYILYVHGKQLEWDEKYGNKK